MCCVLLLAGGIGPRIALFFWWIFGDKPDAAIDSWVWGLLGFLLLPWTTLMYIIAWSPVVGISGFWDGVLIALGVALTSRRTPQSPRRGCGARTSPAAHRPTAAKCVGSGEGDGIERWDHGGG